MSLRYHCRFSSRLSLLAISLITVQLTTSNVAVARKIRFASATIFQSGVSNPGCISTGDFNGDGYPDLVVTNRIQNISVLINNGDATFKAPVNYSTDFYVTGCVRVADFNSDGKLDLVIVGGDSSGNGIALLLGKGDGTFAAPVYTPTVLAGASISVAVGDLNNDGNPDLFIGGNGSSDDAFGDGKGHFKDGYRQAASGYGVALGDFNADGNLDAATTEQADVAVLLGKGDGTFQSPQTYDNTFSPGGITVGDFNRDGKIDLAVSLYNGAGVWILFGKGDGEFAPGQTWFTDSNPTQVISEDFNKDGNPDLAVSNMGGNDVSVLSGNGKGQFPVTLNLRTGTSPAYVVAGDFNHDGSPDLAVADSGDNTVAILLNAAGTFVKLTSSPNPSRFGESVTFTATIRGSVMKSQVPSGVVTFKDGSKVIGHRQLDKGKGSFATSKLSRGHHKIRAFYSGDARFNPNPSPVLVQIVK